MIDRGQRCLFPSVPLDRIRLLRFAIYAFVVFDMLLLRDKVFARAEVPPELYQPVLPARLLSLPALDPTIVRILFAIVVVGAPLAAIGRWPRLTGSVVAVAFTWWQLGNMSYGKVDHDHLALLVACWVLPTVPGAVRRSRLDEVSARRKAGWALRCIQLAVVVTYLGSAMAKVRIGGWNWPTGATLVWALQRRGTDLGDRLLAVPQLLVFGQWIAFVAELLSPVLMFLRGRAIVVAVLFWAGFHAFTYQVLGIHFLPTAVCLLAFLPVERLISSDRADDASVATGGEVC